MFKFSIRDILWLFLVVGIVLAFTAKMREQGEEMRKQGEEMERLKVVNSHTGDTQESLIWQLVSAAEIVKHAGFALTTNEDRVEMTGPFALHGNERWLGYEISKAYAGPDKNGPFTNRLKKQGGQFEDADAAVIIKEEINRLETLLAGLQKAR